MAAPFDLTLPQAVLVAAAIDRAQTALEAAIVDSIDEGASRSLVAIRDELRHHQHDLRSLIGTPITCLDGG